MVFGGCVGVGFTDVLLLLLLLCEGGCLGGFGEGYKVVQEHNEGSTSTMFNPQSPHHPYPTHKANTSLPHHTHTCANMAQSLQ